MDSPLIMLVIAGGLLGLFYLGFARLVSSKDEWKKEKSQNLEMVGFMIVVFVVIGGAIGLMEM
jgi:hypothetical protein